MSISINPEKLKLVAQEVQQQQERLAEIKAELERKHALKKQEEQSSRAIGSGDSSPTQNPAPSSDGTPSQPALLTSSLDDWESMSEKSGIRFPLFADPVESPSSLDLEAAYAQMEQSAANIGKASPAWIELPTGQVKEEES